MFERDLNTPLDIALKLTMIPCFVKVLQNSQENTSARVSFFIKLQAMGQRKVRFYVYCKSNLREVLECICIDTIKTPVNDDSFELQEGSVRKNTDKYSSRKICDACIKTTSIN